MTTRSGGSGTPGQGNNGGTSGGPGEGSGAGGGGAGGVGVNGSGSSVAGNGGPGINLIFIRIASNICCWRRRWYIWWYSRHRRIFSCGSGGSGTPNGSTGAALELQILVAVEELVDSLPLLFMQMVATEVKVL
jgi:hypothetical protein